uniref:Uncharacterized protein n=1 Tax=Heterorhabditis bacteriophora TaxID=37862 RepID=A0A1I7XEX5_HETBA
MRIYVAFNTNIYFAVYATSHHFFSKILYIDYLSLHLYSIPYSIVIDNCI